MGKRSVRSTTLCPAALAALMVLPVMSASAGGYMLLNTTTGQPVKWSGTVTLNLDQGPLSLTINKAAADAMVTNAVKRWTLEQVPESSLSIAIGTNLSSDNANGSAIAPDYNAGCGIGSPIIYDAQGLLTESELGAGMSQAVLGFAGPYCFNSGDPAVWTTIGKGQAVLNGLFIDGVNTNGVSPPDSSVEAYEGVITHEIGHLLNLDHSQYGMSETISASPHYMPTYAGFPTMFPLVHPGMQDLELDDKAWISNLYPSATGLTRTRITGTVFASNGSTKVNGVNIVARSAADHTQCITCVSGFKDGTPGNTSGAAGDGVYEIPMLPTGSQWVLDIEQISSGFTGGSSVGALDPPLTLPGPAEFVNDPASESNSDPVTRSTTFVTPAVAGSSLSGINLTLNNPVAPQVVAEVDNGGAFADATPITVTPGVPLEINGVMNYMENGDIAVGGDDVEDWYAISSPAGVEVTKIVLTPNGHDSDLAVLSWGGSTLPGGLAYVTGSVSIGDGVVETIEGAYDTLTFGHGAGAGKIYVGVTAWDGDMKSGSYTLRIESSVSDKDMVVVNQPAQVNPNSGTISLTGRGFKNTGGAPTVAFSDPGIQVDSVDYVSPTELEVNVTRLAGFTPGGTTGITVTNQAGGGGYSGHTVGVVTAPVSLSSFSAE